MTGVVSAAEFGALQEQLMKLKEEKYEGIEREKKLKREIEKLNKEKAEAEAAAKKGAELPAKAAASAPSPAPATKGSEAELKAQVEALKQSVAQLTQERDRLAKAAAPASAPRKEVPAPAAVDLTALAARFEPPIDPTALSTIESIIKEQQAATAASLAEVQSLREKVSALEVEAGALREVNAKFASNVEESSKGSEAAKRALADLERIKTELNATRTDRDVLAARIGEKELRVDALSDKLGAVQSDLKKSAARVEELTKEAADGAAKVAAAQAEEAKAAARAAEAETKLAQVTEEREKVTKERELLKTELEQLNNQVKQFTTSREEYIAELKKGRSMLEETLEKRGALVATLELRLKEAAEAAHAQSERVKQLTGDLAAAADDLVQHRNALDQFQQADKENNDRIVMLETELAKAKEEAEMASKIAEKKTARQVKDLQEQLQRERAARGGKGPTPTPSMENVAAAAGGKGAKINEPSREDLLRETNLLAMRLGELQTEKSEMEQRNKHLNETLKFMNAELEKKEALIKHGLMNLKSGPSGRSTPDQDRQRLKSGSVFAKEGINEKEVYAKMERITEETIMRNLQLMGDIKTLGDEVAALTEENRRLKAGAGAGAASVAPSQSAPPSIPSVSSPPPVAVPPPASPAPNGAVTDAPKSASHP